MSNRKEFDFQNRVSQMFNQININEFSLIKQEDQQIVEEEEDNENHMPISLLHPYNQNFSIKARVTRKQDIREWKNNKGSGQVFSIDLIDRFDTEITGTFYNNEAQKFHNLIQKDQVYIFVDGKVKLNTNSQYNKKNDHVIIFDERTSISLDSDKNIKKNKLNLVKFSKLSGNKGMFDIMGIIIDEGQINQINLKSGGIQDLRKIILLDFDKICVELNLWGEKGKESWIKKNNIILAKNCYMKQYNNQITINLSKESEFSLADSHNPIALQLYQWYLQADLSDVSMQTDNIQKERQFNSAFKTIQQLELQCQDLQQDQKMYSDIYRIGCIIQHVLIVRRKCRKTMDLISAIIVVLVVISLSANSTGKIWLNVNNESGESIVGKTADQLFQTKTQDPQQQNLDILKERVCSQYDNYNNETRIRHFIIRDLKLDYQQEFNWIHNYILNNYHQESHLKLEK